MTRRDALVATGVLLSMPASACAQEQAEDWPDPRTTRTATFLHGARAGTFDWRDGDAREAVGADPRGGVVVASRMDASGRAGAWFRRVVGPLRPEWFGAVGDGISNDTRALSALARYLNWLGGGSIAFSPRTYCVGMQELVPPGQRYGLRPEPILEFVHCFKGISLQGNGARLRCAPGLRFGTFDRQGRSTSHPLPFYGDGEVATPYTAMILIIGCDGPIEIADLELDGNVDSLVRGGRWGDTGWQIQATGFLLRDNLGPETVNNVYTHHHALDGFSIDGAERGGAALPARRIVNVRATDNGRQGGSIVGGHGYSFIGCSFERSGRGPVSSAPGAGIDLEAEGAKSVADLIFDRCRFIDNAGPGLTAESGDVSRVRFTACRFQGSVAWSAWPRKPFLRFEGCVFAGALANPFGSADAAEATHFESCEFSDVAAEGSVPYVGGGKGGPIVDMGDAQNVRFDRCRFVLRAGGLLPWSVGAIYSDCVMLQQSDAVAYPRGTYLGTTRIVGKVDLTGSRVVGRLTVNGVPVPIERPR